MIMYDIWIEIIVMTNYFIIIFIILVYLFIKDEYI